MRRHCTHCCLVVLHISRVSGNHFFSPYMSKNELSEPFSFSTPCVVSSLLRKSAKRYSGNDHTQVFLISQQVLFLFYFYFWLACIISLHCKIIIFSLVAHHRRELASRIRKGMFKNEPATVTVSDYVFRTTHHVRTNELMVRVPSCV